MRSVRQAVREQALDTAQTQELMKKIVPSISLLHFGATELESGRLHGVIRDHCGTCRSKGEPVVAGRCGTCGDVVELWGQTLQG
jgi:hypothetical protein